MTRGLTEVEAERCLLAAFLPSDILEGLYAKIPLDVAKIIMRCNPHASFYRQERREYVAKKLKYGGCPKELEIEAFLITLDTCQSNVQTVFDRFDNNNRYNVSEETYSALKSYLKSLLDLWDMFKNDSDDWVLVCRIRG